MRAIVLGMSLGVAMSCGPVWAQSNPQNCPPAAMETTGAAAKSSSGGIEPPSQQAIERSAILPNIGGHEQSAAPTVQQDGKPVLAQTECPKPPNRMDAPKTN